MTIQIDRDSLKIITQADIDGAVAVDVDVAGDAPWED